MKRITATAGEDVHVVHSYRYLDTVPNSQIRSSLSIYSTISDVQLSETTPGGDMPSRGTDMLSTSLPGGPAAAQTFSPPGMEIFNTKGYFL